MNNEDNVYELLGNVQVLTKEGVETKFEELEESLPQKINDALGTSLDEKIDEAVSNAVIDAGGVTPALLDEVKAELVATDTALQATDTLLDQRITALENAGPSGGTGDVTTEMLNEVKTELENADTALSERITVLENAEPSGGTGDVTTEMLNDVKTELENADTALSDRVTALEAGGGSGGSTTNEILVLTLDVDADDITDTTAWLLKEVINFDTLYQSYLTKTNKPVVINIAMSDDTGSTQYSFRDVITIADNTQIGITGDAMSTDIAPNLRFTIDLVLMKDETTGNCIINTAESKFLMQEDTGGGSGEAVSEKIFEFTGEYLLDATADEPTFTVNIDAIDSDKFKEAVDDNYKFQLHLRAPQTTMPIVITTYMYAVQTPNYVFTFNLDSLGMVSEELYGRVQISVMQNEETGNYGLGAYGIDKGDDDSLNLVTLDKRVTALEENGSGSGSTDDLSNYTYIIDSQEKFDAFCVATNATEANGNDYSHVLIKNGNYTIMEGQAIRLDNEVVPILSITGESQEGVVITIQATHVFFCVNDNTGTEHMPCIQCISFISADLTTLHSISEKAEKGSSSVSATTESKTNCAYELIGCLLNVSGPIAVHTLRTCIVKLTIPTMTEKDRTPYNKYIKCAHIQDSTITIDCTAQLYNNATDIVMIRAGFNTNKSTIINTTVILDKMFPPQASSSGTTAYHALTAIVGFTYCNNSHCFLADSAFMLFTANSSNITDKPCQAFMHCENVTNCSVTNFKVSFRSCTNISDSIAYIKYACIANKSGNYYYNYTAGFEHCEKVINCSVKGAPSLETDPINSSNSPIVPEGDYSVTSDLRANIYGFVACALLVNCADDIEAIHSLCATASLQYISFTNCGSLVVCGRRESFTYNVYKTLSTSVTTPINISFFVNCDSLTNAYIHCRAVRAQLNDSRATTIRCTDKREYDGSPFITESLALNMCVMRACRDISQSFIYAKFVVDSALKCTHSTNYLLYQCTRVTTSQCMAYGAYTKGAISTVGIQNCTITKPDTATCSASQTYAADYAVADTPAGGFNKIVS